MDFCATPGTGKEIMWLIDAASSANPATLVSVPTAASTSTSGYTSTAASISTVER